MRKRTSRADHELAEVCRHAGVEHHGHQRATGVEHLASAGRCGWMWFRCFRTTFNNRTNGLRPDLANMLATNHPSFMRYPGGNFIESTTASNAVRWKKTIGDIALRPGHDNDSWGYWSTDGFGLQEYLQYCEDIGMQPLYGINCGLMLGWNGNTNNTIPLSQMGPWVQDALDLIQYANGATNTTWGALARRQRPSRAVQSAIHGNRQRKQRLLLQRPLRAVLQRHQIQLPGHPSHRQRPGQHSRPARRSKSRTNIITPVPPPLFPTPPSMTVTAAAGRKFLSVNMPSLPAPALSAASPARWARPPS